MVLYISKFQMAISSFTIQRRDFWFEALESVACLDYYDDFAMVTMDSEILDFDWIETVLAITSLKIMIERSSLKHRKANQV